MQDRMESELIELKKMIDKREALRIKTRKSVSLFASIVSMIGLVVVAVQLFDVIDKTYTPRSKACSIELALLTDKFNDLQQRISPPIVASEKSIAGAAISIKKNKLYSDMKLLDARLAALEAAILENPARALTVPLLRKDLDESSARASEYKAYTRAEIDRLYDQQKWILSGIGTILLAVAGGALTILFRSIGKDNVNSGT